MNYGGFPGNYHQTSPCYCYQHDIPRRYTPVAVSCSLHFTPLWYKCFGVGPWKNSLLISDQKLPLVLVFREYSHLKLRCGSIDSRPNLSAQFGGRDHLSDSPSVHLFFVLPSIEFRCGRKESTSHRCGISTTTHPPPRPPARQSICPTITAPAHAAPSRAPRTLHLATHALSSLANESGITLSEALKIVRSLCHLNWGSCKWSKTCDFVKFWVNFVRYGFVLSCNWYLISSDASCIGG